jgi:hypothetical protein
MNDYAGAVICEDRGPAMQTRSGGFFYLLDPRPEDVYIGDIASHLAKINRYTGASKVPVSVARHSVLVAQVYQFVGCRHVTFATLKSLPTIESTLAVLLHDAAEAYTNDISRPMKLALESRAPGVLKQIEHNIQKAILSKFELEFPPHDTLKHADNVALQMERRDFMAPSAQDWPGLPDPLPWPLEPSPSWEHDEALFLETFNALWAMRA